MTVAASQLIEEHHEIPVIDVAEPAQPNPVAALSRAMRGRWRTVLVGAAALGPAFAAAGFLSGHQLFESQAILRVFPQESNILYATGEESVLKTFDSFVKAETTYVASHPVMERSAEKLREIRADIAADLTAKNLAGSVEIKRSDSLIVLKTLSKDRTFASEKLDAIIAAYLGLKTEADEKRNAFRLDELYTREADLSERLGALRSDQLDVGGEYGLNALAKAHIEKIAQIDGLASRKAEVAATIAALEADNATSSADTSDQEIMRATLLDRAMADLNFERAKLMSELAGMRSGYTQHTNLRFEQKEKAKLEEIAVIEKAMADRREQIRVLGQTGALTDATQSGDQNTLAEIRSLFDKVSGQLEIAREEARDLNRRRIDLDRIENEIQEAERLLEETRRALEVIRLESGRALPGYAVVMSPPSQSGEPAEDNRKLLAVAGMAGGAMIALILVLTLALTERRVRFAETLVPVESRLPVRQVTDAGDGDSHAADLLRNELQLQRLRLPRLVGKAPVIVVTRAGSGETGTLAKALASSFARARMKTLFIDADIAYASPEGTVAGWREVLTGAAIAPVQSTQNSALWHLAAGTDEAVDDRAVSAQMVRAAIEKASKSFDAVILSTGCLKERLSARFILSHSDVGVFAVSPDDLKADVFDHVDHLDTLPRNGSVAVMRNAHRNDPWRTVRT
jgi:Mrp family chromosome partitioning ATPase